MPVLFPFFSHLLVISPAGSICVLLNRGGHSDRWANVEQLSLSMHRFPPQTKIVLATSYL